MKRAHPDYVRRWLVRYSPMTSGKGRLSKRQIDEFNNTYRRVGVYYAPFSRDDHPPALLYGGPGNPQPLLPPAGVEPDVPEEEEFTKIVLLVPKGTMIFRAD